MVDLRNLEENLTQKMQRKEGLVLCNKFSVGTYCTDNEATSLKPT